LVADGVGVELVRVEGWRAGNILGYDAMDRVALAREILGRSSIELHTLGDLRPYQIEGRRTPHDNIYDTAQGLTARTRTFYEVNARDLSTPPTGTPAPDVLLSEDMLRAILHLNDEFGAITITAIAGLNHHGGAQDEHVRGKAFDMVRIHGVGSRRILDFLEGKGFITQRTRAAFLPNVVQFASAGYFDFGRNSLHISIFISIFGRQ